MTTRLPAVLAIVTICGAAMGQTPDDFTVGEEKLMPSDGAAGDRYGEAVAIDGEWLVVGAGGADDSGLASGSVYVFRLSGGIWVEHAKLLPSDAVAEDGFGGSVAIDGDWIAAGAATDDNGESSGSVYLYQLIAGTWVERQELAGSGAEAGEYFGNSVAISGDRLVVGSIYDGDNGDQSGSAYVFELSGDTWVETAKLHADDGASFDYFSSGIDIDGDHIVVGASFGDGNVVDSGSAYIYEFMDGSWIQQQELFVSDGESFDLYGLSVAIDGARIVVGAYGDDDNGSVAGSAYVYERSGGTWVESAKLLATDGAESDRYGFDVAMDHNRIVVGAPRDDDGGLDDDFDSGSIYVYEFASGTWVETKLTAFDGARDDFFGDDVAISGARVLVGAKYADDNGSAYVYAWTSVLNMETELLYYELDDAISDAVVGDRLAVRSTAFYVDGIINAVNKPLTFVGVEPIEMGPGLMFLPGDESSFLDSDDVADAGYSLSGSLIAPESGMLLFSDLGLGDGGELVQNNASLFLYGSMSNEAGTGYLAGNIFTDEGDVSTAVDGTNRVSRDTDVYADYTNAGTTIIQRGILYIYGDLVNTGTLIGEYNNGFAGGSAPEPGDGFSIGGSYTIGVTATLSMPDPVWWLRVGGDLDIAIDDPSNFTMSEATIELNGLAAGKSQALEALSADLGADEAGFDPSNFPIGTLRVTSDSTTQLVNNHPNATNDVCEVLYVNELVVAAGGTLLTNGCPIYARSATIDGTVDDPDAIIIVEETPDCPGDITGDGFVTGADLAIVLGAWGSNDAAADVNGDNTVDGVDLAIVLGAWGACI